MKRRSRHDNRRSELKQRRRPVPLPVPLPQPNVLVDEGGLLDIANGEFGFIRVSCWLTQEDSVEGRKWGKVGITHASIVPFRFRAQLSTEHIKLGTLEIGFHLYEVDGQDLVPIQRLGQCERDDCQPHDRIWLVDLPRPIDVKPQSHAPTEREDGTMKEPWRLRSEAVPSCDRRFRAARWTWDANGHEPFILHGAISLQHQGEAFIIACSTRGKVLRKLHPGCWLRLKFSDQKKDPALVKLEPRNSDADLSQDIYGLEQEMRDLNLGITRPSYTVNSAQPAIRGVSHGRNHEATTIQGEARVQIGDNYYGSARMSRRPNRVLTREYGSSSAGESRISEATARAMPGGQRSMIPRSMQSSGERSSSPPRDEGSDYGEHYTRAHSRANEEA